MRIDDILTDYLRSGWRLEIKSHAMRRQPWDLKPPEGGLDPVDKVGWLVDAYPWAHPKGIKQKVWGGTSDSIEEALNYTLGKIEELEEG